MPLQSVRAVSKNPDKKINDALVVAALFVLVALYWLFKVIIPADSTISYFGNEDLFTYFPQQHKLAFEMWRHGHIPLWNPYQGCGIPLLATAQAQALYPLNVHYLFLPVHIAIGVSTVAHVFLAGAFAFIFMRTRGVSRSGAAVTAIIFMFGGTVIERTFQTSILATAVWLPLVLTAVHLVIHRQRLVDMLLLAASVWMLLTAGWAQLMVYTLYLAGLFVCAELVRTYVKGKTLRQLIIPVTLLLAGCVAGLCLASAQLIPSAELARLSPRRLGSLSIEQIMWFHGSDSLRQFARDFLNPGPASRPRQAYIGIATLILAFLAIFDTRNRRHIWFFAAMAALFGLLSLGVKTPLYYLYHKLPTGDWFRNPGRFRYLWGFSVAVLAGWGTELLAGGRNDRVSEKNNRFTLPIALSVSCLAMLVVTTHLGRLYTVGLLAIGAVALFSTRRTLRYVCRAGLVLLVVCDLYLSVTTLMARPETSGEIFKQQEQSLDYVRDKQTLYRTHILREPDDWTLIGKAGMLTKTYVTNDYEPLTLTRFGNFYSYMICGKNVCAESIPFLGDWFGTYTIVNPRLLDLMSVRYVAQGPGRTFYEEVSHSGLYDLRSASERYPLVHEEMGITFYENPLALPHAYAVGKARVIRDDDEMLRFLASEECRPREEVVLEQDDTVVSETTFFREANLVEYSPGKVVARVTCPSEGYLVLTDNYFPGWQARVNGRTARILRANYTFRAVQLDAGESEVVFEYKPASFRVGATISVATLLVLVALGTSLPFARRFR